LLLDPCQQHRAQPAVVQAGESLVDHFLIVQQVRAAVVDLLQRSTISDAPRRSASGATPVSGLILHQPPLDLRPRLDVLGIQSHDAHRQFASDQRFDRTQMLAEIAAVPDGRADRRQRGFQLQPVLLDLDQDSFSRMTRCTAGCTTFWLPEIPRSRRRRWTSSSSSCLALNLPSISRRSRSRIWTISVETSLWLRSMNSRYDWTTAPTTASAARGERERYVISMTLVRRTPEPTRWSARCPPSGDGAS
jgi:hypothetical protein